MNRIIGFILTIALLISCKNSEKIEMGKNSESNQTELIAQKILDLPKLQWMYHPELKERLPVKVLETELIEKSFNLNKFGQKVRILSLLELKKRELKTT